MENLKKQAKRFQKCLADNGVLKYVITKQEPEIWKLTKQKIQSSDLSLLPKLEDLKEQVKLLENQKQLLKEQLDDFKSNKIQLFEKGQYSNSIPIFNQLCRCQCKQG